MRTFRKIVISFIIVLLIGLNLFLYLGYLLSNSDPIPAKVDIVIVLGGGDGARIDKACELLKQGVTKRLLLINAKQSEIDAVHAASAGTLVLFENRPRSTWQEAQTSQVWMQAHQWKSMLVVSDPPHLLRVRYAWYSIFRNDDVDYHIAASSPRWWSRWLWWRDPFAQEFVKNEVLKLAYYLYQYRFGWEPTTVK